MAQFKVGDVVECNRNAEWQSRRLNSDIAKAKVLGRSFFIGHSAAYMHLEEGYVIEKILPNGGLKLRGFAPLVSPREVKLSTQEVCR